MSYKQISAASWVALVVLLGAALACGGFSGDIDDDSRSPQPTAPAGANDVGNSSTLSGGAADVVVELVEAPAGALCAGTAGLGVSCISPEGTWQTLTADTSGLLRDYITAATSCPDGRFVFADTSALSFWDGTTWSVVEGGWGAGSPDALACAPNGDIWVAHFRGVSLFRGGSWTTYPAADLATGEMATDLVEGVVVAPDGTVWAATANSIASFDGDRWTVYQEGQGFDTRLFFDAITVAPDGTVWVAHGDGAAHFVDGGWQVFGHPDVLSMEAIAVDRQGNVWLGTLNDGVTVLVNGAWTTFNSDNSELGSNRVQSIAVDAQGRIWLATTYGLSLYDGEVWRSYQMHSADLVDNDLRAVAIQSGGPAAPALLEKTPGGLAGQLLFADESPMIGARVEICVQRIGSRFYGETPCDGQPFVRTTETDREGRFALEDVPAGLYVITADPGGDDWAQLVTDFDLSERVPVDPGGTTDVGELVRE